MCRLHPHKAATLIVAFFPVFAFPAKETLTIQVGVGEKPTDTVIIWTDYDRPPEVPEPSGKGWAGLEVDSSWTDGTIRNVRYSHSFLAMMGNRKGYGVDYVHLVDDPQAGEPQYSAILNFIFRGDTSRFYGWEPVHMMEMPDAFPYQESVFTTGSGLYGEVSTYAGNSTTDLTENTWTRLLSREDGWRGYALPSAVPPSGARLRVLADADPLRVYDIQGRLLPDYRNRVEGAFIGLHAGEGSRSGSGGY